MTTDLDVLDVLDTPGYVFVHHPGQTRGRLRTGAIACLIVAAAFELLTLAGIFAPSRFRISNMAMVGLSAVVIILGTLGIRTLRKVPRGASRDMVRLAGPYVFAVSRDTVWFPKPAADRPAVSWPLAGTVAKVRHGILGESLVLSCSGFGKQRFSALTLDLSPHDAADLIRVSQIVAALTPERF